VHRQPVALGLLADQQAEITGGLGEGQLVVTGATAGLQNGDLVAAQLPAAPEPD
jgi:hypothetical protein